MDLSETESIKKRSQQYTEELYTQTNFINTSKKKKKKKKQPLILILNNSFQRINAGTATRFIYSVYIIIIPKLLKDCSRKLHRSVSQY